MSADLNNIPTLDGWVNLTEAAEMLGITRQHAFKKARQAHEGHPNGWKTTRRVGSKPMYVVSTSEIADMLASNLGQNEGTTSNITDLRAGKLSCEDRKAWLKNYGMKSEEWTDEEILLAIGSGHA